MTYSPFSISMTQQPDQQQVKLSIIGTESNFNNFEAFYQGMYEEFEYSDFTEPFALSDDGVTVRVAKVNRYGVVIGHTYHSIELEFSPDLPPEMLAFLARLAYIHFEKSPVKLSTEHEHTLAATWIALHQKGMKIQAKDDFQKKFFHQLALAEADRNHHRKMAHPFSHHTHLSLDSRHRPEHNLISCGGKI